MRLDPGESQESQSCALHRNAFAAKHQAIPEHYWGGSNGRD